MAKLDKFVPIILIILFFVKVHNCNVLNNLQRDRRQIENLQNVSCQLPPHPSRGEWTLLGTQQLQPGDNVPSNSVLTFKCNKEYIFKGANIIYCLNNGSWSDSVGSCEKLCTPLTSTTSTSVICRNEDRLVDCAQPDDGTTAQFSCKPFYQNRETVSTLRVCHEGSWDKPQPRCELACGMKIGGAQSLLAGDISRTEGGTYPWHVGLYNNAKNPPVYLCGGSLISENVIITAAHCVTDLGSATVLSKDIFSIAAGKYYRQYDDPRDIGAQYRKLKQIYVMPSWRGESLLFRADIAILITDEILQLSPHVQPVCMDYDGKVTQSVLENPNPVGTVVGWGGDSEVVRAVRYFYIEYDKCLPQLPEDFQKYLISDRFCLGHANEDLPFCLGSSGNGFVLRNPKDNRFYLTGVLGLAPKSDSGVCDKAQYILPTNVTQYARNIVEKAAYHHVHE